jgi:hypothetical protein
MIGKEERGDGDSTISHRANGTDRVERRSERKKERQKRKEKREIRRRA